MELISKRWSQYLLCYHKTKDTKYYISASVYLEHPLGDRLGDHLVALEDLWVRELEHLVKTTTPTPQVNS